MSASTRTKLQQALLDCQGAPDMPEVGKTGKQAWKHQVPACVARLAAGSREHYDHRPQGVPAILANEEHASVWSAL